MFDSCARVEYTASFGKITLDVERKSICSENYKMTLRLKNRRVIKGDWRGSLGDAQRSIAEKIQIYGNIGKLPKELAENTLTAFNDWRFGTRGAMDWRKDWEEVKAQWEEE